MGGGDHRGQQLFPEGQCLALLLVAGQIVGESFADGQELLEPLDRWLLERTEQLVGSAAGVLRAVGVLAHHEIGVGGHSGGGLGGHGPVHRHPSGGDQLARMLAGTREA